jgi:tRNA (uracil-5-)-methyltransferase TRM9
MDVYDKIALDFSRTRYKIWRGVYEFLNSLPTEYLILDAGCGNGKNMLETKHIFHGLDMSDELLKIASEKTKTKSNVIGFTKGSVCALPFTDSYFDATMCIAVIHHLNTEADRLRAIREMIRTTKKGGKILITVWQLENNDKYTNGLIDPTECLTKGDRMIKWTYQKITYYRYYHFFTFNEIEQLIKNIESDISSYEIKSDMDNYYIYLTK